MCPVIASKGLFILRECESDVESQNTLQEPKFYRNSLQFESDISANPENNFVRIEHCPTNLEKKASKSS